MKTQGMNYLVDKDDVAVEGEDGGGVFLVCTMSF